MPVYYIISQTGFLKRYYSEANTSDVDPNKDNIIFLESLRGAKAFPTIEEANKVMVDKSLTGCFVINQNGIMQK